MSAREHVAYGLHPAAQYTPTGQRVTTDVGPNHKTNCTDLQVTFFSPERKTSVQPSEEEIGSIFQHILENVGL